MADTLPWLASLPAQLAVAAAGRPELPLGAVLRVPLPLSGALVVVDRMRRALAPPGQPGAQLGLSADAIELEVGAAGLLHAAYTWQLHQLRRGRRTGFHAARWQAPAR